MRKAGILIAVLIFLTATTPVFAATLNFSAISGWLHVFRFGSMNTPIGLDGPVQRKVTPYIYPTARAIPIQQRAKLTGYPLPTFVPEGDGGGVGIIHNPTVSSTPKTEQVKAVISTIPDTYQNRLNQYGDFLTKVKSRRDKLAADGKDVTKVDQFITTATDNLATATTVLATEKTTLGNLDPTQDPAQLEKTVHDQLTVVRQSMTAVNNSMSATVRQIVAQSVTTTGAPPATTEGLPRQNGGVNQGQGHLPPGPANRK
jgi:hypothetical protein